ncbi:ladderlectin-like [Antennarius striatus]|uniref:ladderlectin-like n=1 Tax=Antennarius striatus TaxID=241820 RepID=UPI0035B4CB57
MTTVLVLSILLCAAFAAPAEQEPPVVEDRTVAEGGALVPEDAAPVSDEARSNRCPTGWLDHGSRCFLFVSSAMTWYSAEEHCNTMGAHLASATNPSEYRLLQDITRSGGQSIAWLGGFNLQGNWMWIDREGFYYTNWYASITPVSSYPCLYLRSNYGWGNTGCSYSRPFICSKNLLAC